MSEKEEIKYNKCVGVIDDEIYYLDKVFKDSNSFKGAVGTVFRAVSKEEYDERLNDLDYFEELWVNAVNNKMTNLGLNDWIETLYNKEDIIFDTSYSELHEDIREIFKLSEEDYPIIECMGGGRCFFKNMKFDKIINKELIKIINEYEKEEVE